MYFHMYFLCPEAQSQKNDSILYSSWTTLSSIVYGRNYTQTTPGRKCRVSNAYSLPCKQKRHLMILWCFSVFLPVCSSHSYCLNWKCKYSRLDSFVRETKTPLKVGDTKRGAKAGVDKAKRIQPKSEEFSWCTYKKALYQDNIKAGEHYYYAGITLVH